MAELFVVQVLFLDSCNRLSKYFLCFESLESANEAAAYCLWHSHLQTYVFARVLNNEESLEEVEEENRDTVARLCERCRRVIKSRAKCNLSKYPERLVMVDSFLGINY